MLCCPVHLTDWWPETKSASSSTGLLTATPPANFRLSYPLSRRELTGHGAICFKEQRREILNFEDFYLRSYCHKIAIKGPLNCQQEINDKLAIQARYSETFTDGINQSWRDMLKRAVSRDFRLWGSYLRSYCHIARHSKLVNVALYGE